MKRTLLILLASASAAGAQDYCWVNFAGGFSSPYGADTDSADNIYIADRGASVIRKITPGGTVSTLTGLTGSLVELVVNKVNGNIYFSDLGTGNIMVSVPPYTSATIRGSGVGTVIGLGIDSATDTVYVGSFDQTIKKITSAGVVSTVAGSGAAGLLDGTLATAKFNNPCGIAVVGSGASAVLYVMDRENHAVRKVDIAGDSVTTPAGNGSAGCVDGTGSNARFTAPTGITLGPDGNFYIADQDNGSVRKMTPAGVVTTLGGNCTAGTPADGCGSAAHFGNIGQVAVDSTGHIYTADRGSDHIEKGTPPAPPSPPNITSISFQTGVGTDYCWTEFTGQGGNYAGAYGATVDTSSGTIYVAALGSGIISSLTPAGTATPLAASVTSPVELSVSTTTHNLYVGSLSGGAVKVVPPYGAGDVSQLDGNYTCFATAVDSASETVYAANTGGNVIRIIKGGSGSVLAGDGTGGFVDNVPLLSAEFRAPCGLAVVVSGGNTNIYVADRDNNRIRKIDIGANMVTTLAGGAASCADGIGSAAGFVAPTGCTLGPDGNLYIADQDALTIRKVTLPGGVVTTIGSDCSVGFGNYGLVNGCGSVARFSNIGQCGVAADGTVYVADRTNGDVRKGAPPANTIKVRIDFTGSASDTPALFTLQSSGNVGGTYNDVAATITQLAPGSFRAEISPSGDMQFYRIKR